MTEEAGAEMRTLVCTPVRNGREGKVIGTVAIHSLFSLRFLRTSSHFFLRIIFKMF